MKKTYTHTCSSATQETDGSLAILVFSRQAHEEAREKKFNGWLSPQKGEQLASHLIRHTLDEARKSGLPVIEFFTDQQQGQTFGERLTHAIEHGFAAGFDQLLVCGTDSPAIDSELFTQAAQQLQTHDLVLGPSTDGGVYLIGLHKQTFHKDKFLQISWLTCRVFGQLTQYAASLCQSLAIHTAASDVDGPRDLLLSSHVTVHWFRCVLAELLLERLLPKTSFFAACLRSAPAISTGGLRGPPSVAA